MNILIVGNGFDIAHGLPTRYSDFLECVQLLRRAADYNSSFIEFCKTMKNTPEKIKDYIGRIVPEDSKNKTLKLIFSSKASSAQKEMVECVKENFWIEWFKKKAVTLGEGWIDFELEISCVVQAVESALKKSEEKDGPINVLTDLENKVVITLKAEIEKGQNVKQSITPNYKDFSKKLIDDLNRLIRCLEIYLVDCVGNVECPIVSQDILDLGVDWVLSFNYTDTYSKLYLIEGSDFEFDYIHGKAKLESTPANNMVLGIDEYLQGDARNTNVEYIAFKKYFQRIHKRTGCEYKRWLEQIRQYGAESNVYVYGHSLATTDKDVLKEIMTSEYIRTTVFYHNSDAYAQQISSLVQVLGQDKLIEMVYGDRPRIMFRKQTPMVAREDVRIPEKTMGSSLFPDLPVIKAN